MGRFYGTILRMSEHGHGARLVMTVLAILSALVLAAACDDDGASPESTPDDIACSVGNSYDGAFASSVSHHDPLATPDCHADSHTKSYSHIVYLADADTNIHTDAGSYSHAGTHSRACCAAARANTDTDSYTPAVSCC